jgi:hypothetical protein
MGSDLAQAVLNGVLVAIGLYALWRYMPRHAPGERLQAAAVAGAVSGVATLVVRALV